MALALPLILGAAALLVLGKKKRRKSKSTGGEPGEAPGAGWDGEEGTHPAPIPIPPRPGPGQMGGGMLTAGPSSGPPPIIGWNATVASRARQTMEAQWHASNKVLSGGKFFVLQRNTAMELWPHVKWPITINDALRVTEPTPGHQVPTWIFKLGSEGSKAERIWFNLRELAWNITGYKPPV